MTTLTCLACGQADREVAMRLVEIPAPEQRVVPVSVVARETRRGVEAFDYLDVRERYVSEPRCRDTTACQTRVDALVDAIDEETPSWMG